jgi:hypothetical protein
MARKLPPDHDPVLRQVLASPDADQLAQLRAMNGDQPAFMPAAQAPVTKQPPRPRKPRATSDFQHPEDAPSADDMLQELADSDARRYGYRFGLIGLATAEQAAADAECLIYNSWVTLQCLKHGLRSPGKLSAAAFIERFWGER